MIDKTKQPGFTLIELLVAMVITLIMLGIIGAVYQQTGKAVSRGIGLSSIIASNRGVNPRITDDFEFMKGPGSNKGFLVIANHTVLAQMPEAPNSYHNPPSPGSFATNPQSGWAPDSHHPYQHLEWIRDDQIVFVRNDGSGSTGGTMSYPMTPINPLEFYKYANEHPNETADGNAFKHPSKDYIIVWYGHAVRTNKYGNFKNTPTTPWQLGVASDGRNSLATQWILGRQDMYFADYNNHLPDNALLADGPLPDSTMYRYSSPAPPGNVKNYMGTCDVAHYVYVKKNNGHNSVIGGILKDSSSAKQYKKNAVKFLYAGPHRLRVCTNPHYEPGNADYQYNPWQVAQTHGALSVGVSDIEIAFAADISGNSGPVDKITSDVIYEGNVVLSAGSVKWYVSPGFENNPDESGSNHGTGYDPSQPVTFAVPGGYAPLLNVGSSLFPAHVGTSFDDQTFVWRHDAGTSTDPYGGGGLNFWPSLIRIRYRMHGSNGRIKSGYHQQGMWFTHIIKVPR